MATLSATNFSMPVHFSSASRTSKRFHKPRHQEKNLNFTFYASEMSPFLEDLIRKSLPVLPPKKVEIASTQPLLGPLVLSGMDLVSDFSGHVRKHFDTGNVLFGIENPVSLGSLGLTSTFSFFSGGLNIRGGLQDIAKTQEISDTTGTALAAVRVAIGAGLLSLAACFVPMRALSITALLTASKIAASVSAVLGKLGGAASNVVSILAGVSIGIRLNEQRQFRSKLDEVLSNPNLSEEDRYAEALQHLKQLATITPQEKAQIAQEITSNPKYRSLNSEQIAKKIEKRELKLLSKKESYLKRLTDDDCIKSIRKDEGASAKGIVDKVKSKSTEKVVLSSIALTLVAIGIAMTVASFFLGPVGVMIAAGVGIVTSLSWVLLDAYSLLRNYNESDPGRFDKVAIFISSVLAVTAVTAVFFLSSGVVPIVVASVVGAVWLGLNLFSYWRIRQFEEKKALENL